MGHTYNSKHTSFIIAVCSLSSITILTGLSLASSYVSADDVVDNIAITVPISCTDRKSVV